MIDISSKCGNLGFLTGHEMGWLSAAVNVLKNDLCKIDVTASSQTSPELADGLLRGRTDLAFLRRELNYPDLIYKTIAQEPLVVILPSDHELASLSEIAIEDIHREKFIGAAANAPSLQRVIDDYLRNSGVNITPKHTADNLAMAMSLVASTRGMALLPAYARNFLPWSVTSRPLAGVAPTIGLAVGYNRLNTSDVVDLFLLQVDSLVERVPTAGVPPKFTAASNGVTVNNRPAVALHAYP